MTTVALLTPEQIDAIARVAAQQVGDMLIRKLGHAPPRPAQVTQKEAARMLGVSPRTVQNYVRGGAMRLNAAGRVPIEEVDKLMEARK
jgi:predicted transcriptional regulator